MRIVPESELYENLLWQSGKQQEGHNLSDISHGEGSMCGRRNRTVKYVMECDYLGIVSANDVPYKLEKCTQDTDVYFQFTAVTIIISTMQKAEEVTC